MLVNILLGVVCGIPIGKLVARAPMRVIGVLLLSVASAASSVALYMLLPRENLLSGIFPLYTLFAALVAVQSGEAMTWRNYVLIVCGVLGICLLYGFLDFTTTKGLCRFKSMCIPSVFGYAVGGAMVVYRIKSTLWILIICGCVLSYGILLHYCAFELLPMIIGVGVCALSMIGWTCVMKCNNYSPHARVSFDISVIVSIIVVR